MKNKATFVLCSTKNNTNVFFYNSPSLILSIGPPPNTKKVFSVISMRQ